MRQALEEACHRNGNDVDEHRHFARVQGRPVVILRPFSIYDPGEQAGRLIPTLMLAALRDKEISLTSAGYGRDFVFVHDVVDACLKAVSRPDAEGEIINIGSGEHQSNMDVAEIVKGLIQTPFRRKEQAFDLRPGDSRNRRADISKAKRVLGWSSEHSLRQGLEKTLHWFRRHADEYPKAGTR